MKKFICLSLLALAICSSVQAGNDVTQNDTLRIMTYNIKFLPKELVGQKHHPLKRVNFIPEMVIKENVDVVVFEEAFDHVGVRKLIKKMKDAFPFTAGFRRGRGMLPKSSGGVLMFSKFPILATAKTRYTQGVGVDRIGKKGAIMAEIQKGIRRLQIIGTHMQAGGSNKLKMSQIKEMAALGAKCSKPGIPQFYCGDFNINKSDTALYPQLTKAFNACDGDITGECKYTDDHINNDMEDHSWKAQEIIDFIFYKDNGVQPKSVKREIRQFRKRWSKEHQDLSDHFALVMETIF